MILDEPTIGLDPAAAVDLRRAIAQHAPAHSFVGVLVFQGMERRVRVRGELDLY